MQGRLPVSGLLLPFSISTGLSGTVHVAAAANKKAGSRLVVLVDGPVQECLKAAARPWAPARGITTVSDQGGRDVLQMVRQREPQRGVPLLIWHGHVRSTRAYGVHDEWELVPDGQLKGRLPILSPARTCTPKRTSVAALR